MVTVPRTVSPNPMKVALALEETGLAFQPHPVSTREHYTQRALIAQQFDYRLWSSEFHDHLVQQAEQIARRDITPGFIVAELIAYLRQYKVERPGYTTMQTVVSQALSTERQRLAGVLASLTGMLIGSLGPQAIRNQHGSHHRLVGVV